MAGMRPAAVTAQGRITARQVLLAGDVYHKLEANRLRGLIFPAMGGIVATAPLGALAQQLNPQDLAVYDCRFVLDNYRLTALAASLFYLRLDQRFGLLMAALLGLCLWAGAVRDRLDHPVHRPLLRGAQAGVRR